MGRAIKRVVLRLIKLPPRLIYAVGLGSVYGRVVLLLTTIGRKSGRPRVTPLQYEKVGDVFVVGSARGSRADWVRNLMADRHVGVRVRRSRFWGVAEVCEDVGRIADFLELRLRRHPRMVGGIMRLRGVPRHPSRAELEEYAGRSVIVTIVPSAESVLRHGPEDQTNCPEKREDEDRPAHQGL